MLIGSSACSAFTTWQALNMARSKDPGALMRAKIDAIMHLNLVASLYQEQMDGDRYFLHGHPLYASS